MKKLTRTYKVRLRPEVEKKLRAYSDWLGVPKATLMRMILARDLTYMNNCPEYAKQVANELKQE